jgi:CRISPR system Cascade subunit CasA
LFDHEVPFFQVPGLRTARNEVGGLAKIVADVPNGEPLFTTRSADSLRRIDPGEAARWLVHVHAFDPSGIKSGAVGDTRVKGGRGYPIGTGWSGQLGGVLPEGSNIRETLLLNLIARDADAYVRLGGPGDVPAWEHAPDTATWQEDRPPAGAIDLYTWQTRRVRLVGDRAGVTGVVLANGDKIQPQNRHGLDPHSAWRYSEPQSKKARATVYMPRMHDPNRAVWRGIGAMLPSTAPRRGVGGEPQRFLAPGVLQWIGDLVAEGHLPDNFVPRLRVQGAQYGAQSATFGEIVDDALSLSVVVLRQDHPEAGRAAERAVEDAEHAASALWRFAENIAQAAGAEPKSGAGERAQEALYAALGQPYRRWLAQLQPGCDLRALCAEWQLVVRDACRPIAEELVASASTAAWRGRTVNKRLINVPLADALYAAAIRKALPDAFMRAAPISLEVAG